MSDLIIRDALPEDGAALLAIYKPYVEHTAITFEYEVPSLEEFTQRIINISGKYPYILAMEDDKILGYAYAGVYKGRAAYDWSVETTVYVDENLKGKGIGGALYRELEERLKAMGILNMYACIAKPRDKKDPYCTMDSMDFHEHMGFALNGTFHLCGYKFNRWYDMVWMEKMIGEHLIPAAPVHFPMTR